MNSSWLRGSLWERFTLRWTRSGPEQTAPVEILREFREARKILIIPNDRVGGLFIGAPFYKVIRHFYPQAQIDLLVEERKVSIARKIPFIDSILSAPQDMSVRSSAFKKIAGDLRLRSFDLCFCLGLDCSFKLTQLCGASGARLRVGFQRRALRPFNIEVVPEEGTAYEGERYLSLLRIFGLSCNSEVRWTLAQDKVQKLSARVFNEEFAGGMIVAIDLNSGESEGLGKRQLEYIIGGLIERGAQALLFFSLADRKQVIYLKECYGRQVIPFEQDDMVATAALLGECAALISCNTDLLHLGLALEIPVVGIFDDDPRRWIPPQRRFAHEIEVSKVRQASGARIMEGLEIALQGKKENA